MTETTNVHVGVVGKPHGVRGDVFIDVRTDEVDKRFFPGAALITDGGTELRVATARQHQGRLVVSFEGVPDRTAVEDLRGQVLTVDVPAGERPSGKDEYFDRQLVGLDVQRHDGSVAGTVRQVQHFPAQDLLVVRVGGEDRLVPFVGALVPTVDLDRGFVQLADVRGLLEDPE